MLLKCRDFECTFPRPVIVMGIVNVTPDSFSDGGEFLDAKAAVERALKLVEEGAEIIDVGGESTRPGATPVSEAEELRRVVPVIEELARAIRRVEKVHRGSVRKRDDARPHPGPLPQEREAQPRVSAPPVISIDTMKPGVAKAALQAGAAIVNDVAANREDEEMWRVVADAGAGYVVMHMQGTPQTMQVNPAYADVSYEVGNFFFERLERLSRCGIARDQTILDPGIGFGKRQEHNLQLLGALGTFGKLERPLLLGVSRKSFLAAAGEGPTERLPAALACACHAVAAGVQMIRTHDVAATVQAVRMTETILGRKS
jgi:dihydropteroate synthase